MTLHEPVIVRLEVFNESTQPITVRLGLDRKENFASVIRLPDGSAQQRPPLPQREGAFALGDVALAPGERLRHPMLLNEWASLSTPGDYELDVRLLTPIELGSGEKLVAKPYHTRFKILPRDEAKLSAACEKLARQIESTFAVREGRDAATALGYVNDPIVVPYLERVLRSGKYVEQPVIDGLVRIGSESAARVLMAVVRESPAWPPSVDTSAGTRTILAWQGLHRIAANTSNEQLRQEIRRTIP